MRLQISVLIALLLLVTMLVAIVQPTWANQDPSSHNQPRPQLISAASGETIGGASASAPISITRTPTAPTTTLMPTGTPTTGSAFLLYAPALVDMSRGTFMGNPTDPCSLAQPDLQTVPAEPTSTPAPTVTPTTTQVISTTPPLTTTFILSSTVCPPNDQEAALAELLVNSPIQEREILTYNPVLAQTARNHAMDMAIRGYFGSIDPSGIGPNFRTRHAGFVLPDFYGDELNANNIESTVAGFATAQEAWAALSAEGGNIHATGAHDGYRYQDEYGIGYAYVKGSIHERYWVVIIAQSGVSDGAILE